MAPPTAMPTSGGGLPPRPGTSALRTLVLLRHATAHDKQKGRDDVDRQLTSEGEQEAVRVAARLAGLKVAPNLVLASPAPRALRTAQLVVSALRLEPSVVRPEASLYQADARALQALLEKETQHATILVVGHNPGLEDLVATFGGTPTDWRLEKAHAAILRVPPPGRLRVGAVKLDKVVGPSGEAAPA